MQTKIFTLLLSLLLASACSIAQNCLPGGIIFEEQSEIDNFAIDYPGCTTIEGNVEAEDGGIFNLNGLSQVTSILGYLKIEETDNLINLEGLNNLTTIGGDLVIAYTDDFQSLSGLENLQSIGGDLTIQGNDELVDLSGLENLTTIGGDILFINDELNGMTGMNSLTSVNAIHLEDLPYFTSLEGMGSFASTESFTIRNTAVTTLQGLENLATVDGTFYIKDNEDLLNLNGIENLQSISGSLLIIGNTSLTELSGLINFDFFQIGEELNLQSNSNLAICHHPYTLCDYISATPNSTEIGGNAIGCHTHAAILDNCELGQGNLVRYPIFYDLNENGTLDSNEPYYAGGCVAIEQTSTLACGNNVSGGLIYLPDGTYTFSFDPLDNPGWDLTSSPASYSTVVDQNVSTDTLFFGMVPNAILSDVNATTTSHVLRCNRYVTFTNMANNLSTSTASGTLWFQTDENIQDVDFLIAPDVFISPNTYGWNFSDLYPSHSIQKKIKLKIPGPNDLPIGTELQFSSWVNYSDDNGQHTSEIFHYNQLTQCAYDPNDKLVNPNNPLGYALLDEPLTYTIRFQNTGNAVAYDVVIRDTLSDLLNPVSFKMISSSHDYALATTLSENKYLTFDFSNIFLPDSTTDFAGSQGHVVYQIHPIAGLPEETIINNTASIYFDLNPAIVTNTTENILVSSLDADDDGSMIWDDCDDMNATIYPGAVEIANNGIDEDCDGEDLMTGVEHLSKSKLIISPNPTSDFISVRLPNVETVTLEVKDINGRTVKATSFREITMLNISELTDGVYTLLARGKKEVWIGRVVKF